jgi:hypothetical protein
MSGIDGERAQLALLQKIADSLRELVTWTQLIGYSTVKQTLETVLDSNEKRLVYHLTDGQRSVAEIQEMTGVNARFISEWGREWERIGIVEQSHTSKIRGRRQRVFDLAAFGISVPDQAVSNEGEE